MMLFPLLLLATALISVCAQSAMRFSSNSALIEHLARIGVLRSEKVRSAMLAVDRKNYCLPATVSHAYDDSPQYIGFDATISAPHMHAYCMDKLLPFIIERECNVMDVGCGSGYLCALISRINPKATVYGIDIKPGLVELSAANIRKKDGDLLDTGRVRLSEGSGWDGVPGGLLFDAIHVGAAAESVPRSLLQQLKIGGTLIVPVGPEGYSQKLVQVTRKGGSGNDDRDFHIDEILDVAFVPLVKE